MLSRRNSYLLFILLMIFTLSLSACVRPVPGESTEATPPPEETDLNVGGGTDGGQTQPAPEEGETTGGEQPQPAPEEGETTGSEQPQPAPEEGETTGGEQPQPAPEEGETTGGEQPQPAPESGDQSGEQTETSPPATGGQPEQGGGFQVGTPPTTEVIHTVQPGENLFRIGLQYGYSWVVLSRYNGIPNPNYIYVGQLIRIPPAGGGGSGGLPPTDGNYSYYVVQPGDNLFRIGLKYGMSWVWIAEANGLINPHYIVTGQVLKIPVVPTPYS